MNPHKLNCDKETCPVCHSRLTELQTALKPLFIHIRYNQQWSRETNQERITSYD